MEGFNTFLPTYIDDRLSPHSIIDCKIGNSWISLDCIIDTGFVGYIVLPTSVKKYFTSNPLSEQKYIVGTGELVNSPVYPGEWKHNAKTYPIDVIFSKVTTPLLGVKFLRTMKLILDYKEKYISLHT